MLSCRPRLNLVTHTCTVLLSNFDSKSPPCLHRDLDDYSERVEALKSGILVLEDLQLEFHRRCKHAYSPLQKCE